MNITRTLSLLAACALATACDGAPEPELDAELSGTELRDGAGQGGPVFNTHLVNLTEVPSLDTLGNAINGVSLDGVEVVFNNNLEPILPGTLKVQNGTVEGVIDDGMGGSLTVSGFDFLKSVWHLDINGSPRDLQISEMEWGEFSGLHAPSDPTNILMLSPDRLVYSFRDLDSPRELHTCPADEFGHRWTILSGDVDVDEDGDLYSIANRVYFACSKGAVGKSFVFGYGHDRPNAPFFDIPTQSTAIDMVRAAYCDDDRSWTITGEMIKIADRDGHNEHGANIQGFESEALWEVGGRPVCVNQIRKNDNGLLAAPLNCGSLTDPDPIPLCGDESLDLFATYQDGYIWTRTPAYQ